MVILRNKEDWRVYPEEIAKRSKDKVSAVRTGIKELEEHHYIRTCKKGWVIKMVFLTLDFALIEKSVMKCLNNSNNNLMKS